MIQDSNKPAENIPMAMFLALMTAFLIGAMNLCGKVVGEVLSPVEITFARNFIALIFLVIGFLMLRKLDFAKTQRLHAQIIRALCGTLGIFFGFWSVTIMPLADATAFLFTQPLWVVLLAYPLLGERVGIYRIGAVIVGFSGILLIAGPSGNIGWFEVIIGLNAGFWSGIVSICLSWLGRTESAFTTVFYFLFIGSILTFAPLPFLEGGLPDLNITTIQMLFLLLLGVTGLSSLIVKTYSYRLGPASLITPVSYTMIIWSGLFDYFFWDKLPTFGVIVGSAMIVASNLFILWRENKAKQTHDTLDTKSET